MVSDLVTPSVEQCCFIILLANENMKPVEIRHRLNAQNGEETLSCGNVSDWYSFLKTTKKLAHGQPKPVCIVNIHSVKRADFGKQVDYNV
jgi:hypothetical protein